MEPLPLVTRRRVGDGGLFRTTSRRKVELAVALPSLTVIVISEEPIAPGTGVTVTNRFAPLPPNAIPEFATTAVFDEMPVTVRLAAAVSKSPMVNGMGAVGILV